MNLGLRPPPDDDLLPANEFNPGGYWESRRLADLNDALLARWSATWWTPPSEVGAAMLGGLDDARAGATAAFEAVFGREPGWVWKDPRLTVLLPFWAPALPAVPILVPFREPAAVAASITARDGLTPEQSRLVWERHTRLLLATLAGRPVLVAEHRSLLDDPDRWSARLRTFAGDHDLPVRAPRTRPGDLVAARASEPPVADLTGSQRALLALCRDHAGAHASFPSLELPPPSDGLDDVVLPAWYTTSRA